MDKHTVLIVDDEDILAKNLSAYLQRCGWETRIADCGRAALAIANEFFPQFLLLDYRLPDMTGLQLLDKLRDDNHRGACILMTGHPEDVVAADARNRHVLPLLTKPFSMSGLPDKLLAAAGKLCAGSSEDGAAHPAVAEGQQSLRFLAA